MRTITKEQAERNKHLKWCTGYDDCDCFSSLWSHREIYDMQREIEKLRSENERLVKIINEAARILATCKHYTMAPSIVCDLKRIIQPPNASHHGRREAPSGA